MYLFKTDCVQWAKALLIAALFSLLGSESVIATVKISELNKFDTITFHTKGDQLRIGLAMEKSIEKNPTVTFFKEYIQLDFPNSYLHEPKLDFTLASDFVTSAKAFQLNNETLRIRLFTETDARRFSSDTSIIVDKNRVTLAVTLDPRAAKKSNVERTDLPQLLNETKSGDKLPWIKPTRLLPKEIDNSGNESHPTVEMKERLESELSKLNLPNQASDSREGSIKNEAELELSRLESKIQEEDTLLDLIKAKQAKESKASSNSTNSLSRSSDEDSLGGFNPTIKMVGSLFFTLTLFILLITLFSHLLKKFRPSNTMLVQTLAKVSLGSKQQLVVIDIAGEVMAIGVSNDNISFLSHIKSDEIKDRLRLNSSVSDKEESLLQIGESAHESTIFGKLGSLLRIGKLNLKREPPALVDENDVETFAGQLKENIELLESDDEEVIRSKTLERELLLKKAEAAIRMTKNKGSFADIA
ncbi:MAG: flagellar biosynthetic protein FliO [Nitrospinota bacterium]